MSKQEFKTVTEYEKKDDLSTIDEFFRYLSINRIVFNGWKKQANGQRILFKLQLDDLNPVEPEVKVNLIDCISNKNQDLTLFNKNDVLSLYTDSQKYVADVKVVYASEKHLIILPPEWIYQKVHRQVPRIRMNCNASSVVFKKNSLTFECPVIDISETGLAISIPYGHSKYFQYPKDQIYIEKLFNTDLSSTIQGAVVYSRQFEDSKQYRVGIVFYDEVELVDLVPQEQVQQAS